MRLFSLIVLSLSCAQLVVAQNPAEPAAMIRWDAPFEPPASANPSDGLVLLVITNDPPWQPKADRARRPDPNPAQHQSDSSFWCQQVLDDAIRQALSSPRQRKRVFRFQSIKAGLPAELTGGQLNEFPSQSVVAVCDDQYRLLSFVVGVPDADELTTMIEDAQETSVIVQGAKDDPQTVINRLADRSRSRIGRLFRTALDETVLSASSDGDDENHADPKALRHQIRIVSQDADPIYLLDAKLRFGLSDSLDRRRLQVLEQHVETRRPWSELMLPFIAGVSVIDTWQPLVESIWGHPPVTDGTLDPELNSWIQSQSESSAVVLMLKPPMKYEHLLWPPPTDPVNRRIKGWNSAHARALEHPFRAISIAESALLIRELGFSPINIFEPSLVRYLFLDSNRREPLVVRESDPPSRFAGILKRSKSTLVAK